MVFNYYKLKKYIHFNKCLLIFHSSSWERHCTYRNIDLDTCPNLTNLQNVLQKFSQHIDLGSKPNNCGFQFKFMFMMEAARLVKLIEVMQEI